MAIPLKYESRWSRRNSVMTARFPDLAAWLTSQTPIALIYSIGCILIVYAVNHWANEVVLFLITELPTLLAMAYVVSASHSLRFRVPFLQFLSAVFMWTYAGSTAESGGWAAVISSVCLLAFFGYCITRAVTGSMQEFRENVSTEPVTPALALLFTAWGATAQVVMIVLALVKTVLPVPDQSIAGLAVRGLLSVSPAHSLLSIVPIGLLVLGLLLYTALRFKDEPYDPPDYATVAKLRVHPVVDPILAAVCIPVWVAVVILGFVFQFFTHLWSSIRDFFVGWFGRLMLILVGLVFPVATMLIGHQCLRAAMRSVMEVVSLSGESNQVGQFVIIHSFALLALSLYVVAVAPMSVEVVQEPPLAAIGRIAQSLREEGFPASNAVGRAFALYGVVFLAVPTANLLPGSKGFGFFSIVYSAVGLLLLCVIVFRPSRVYPRR